MRLKLIATLIAAVILPGISGCGGDGSLQGGGGTLSVRALWEQPRAGPAVARSGTVAMLQALTESDFGPQLPAAAKTLRVLFDSPRYRCCLAVPPAEVPDRQLVLIGLPTGNATVQLAAFSEPFAPNEGSAGMCTTDGGVGEPCSSDFATPSFESDAEAVGVTSGRAQTHQIYVFAQPFLLNPRPAPDIGSDFSPALISFTVASAVGGIQQGSVQLEVNGTLISGDALSMTPCDDAGSNPCSSGGDLAVSGFQVSASSVQTGVVHVRVRALNGEGRDMDVSYTFNSTPAPTPGPFDFALDALTIDGNVGAAGNADGVPDFVDGFDDDSVSTPPTSCFSLLPPTIQESDGFLHLRSTDGAQAVLRSGRLFQEGDAVLDACGDDILLLGAGTAEIRADFRADIPQVGQFYGLGIAGTVPLADSPSVALVVTRDSEGFVSVIFEDQTGWVLGSQHVGLVSPTVTLRLSVNDQTKEVTASYNTDGGTTPRVVGKGTVFNSGPNGIVFVQAGQRVAVAPATATPTLPVTQIPTASATAGFPTTTPTFAPPVTVTATPTPSVLSPTATPSPTGGGSPLPTPSEATATPTTVQATATARPTPSGPAIILDIVTASRGQQLVPVSARLFSGGAQVVGTQNTITFDNTNVTLNVTSNGKADCTVNPAINKGGTSFGLQPPRCTGGACNGVKALVLALDNADVIPDGLVLYTCRVNVAANATDSILTISGVELSNAAGVPVVGGSGVNGGITVLPSVAGG
jgi:hypothetical protein